jgi:hypothetical protein
MMAGLRENFDAYNTIRENKLGSTDAPPALVFDPLPRGWRMPVQRELFKTQRDISKHDKKRHCARRGEHFWIKNFCIFARF